MTPEKQQEVAQAYRISMDRNPDADRVDRFLTKLHGRPMTLRAEMEDLLSGRAAPSGETFYDYLEEIHGAALDAHLESVRTGICRTRKKTRKAAPRVDA
jgi:hypothetical protein